MLYSEENQTPLAALLAAATPTSNATRMRIEAITPAELTSVALTVAINPIDVAKTKIIAHADREECLYNQSQRHILELV